ncbi:hypothetical protein TIFTF001_027897 [Ficus carica]|uniref:Uncharacterized protein n=1 Tax=Ficus carica TaxID=3494 RepID=A0AA88J0E0_FICCA|nr:hypothetical protein TIFTF001_027897 [Ficus carica]
MQIERESLPPLNESPFSLQRQKPSRGTSHRASHPTPFSPPSEEPEADRHPFRPRQGLGLKSQPPRHRFCSRPVNRTRSLSTKPSQRKFLKNSGNRRRIAMESKENTSISAMDEVQEILGNNSLEDVTWLCSLSESELDMLIGLKMLVVQRARTLGCEESSRKFDLKMLRSLGASLFCNQNGGVPQSTSGLAHSNGISQREGQGQVMCPRLGRVGSTYRLF